MQALQGHFSYLLNSRLGSTGNLENEKQHLLQQQKVCKARARKFLLETNRRRKGLDEQRKRWDIQEQRLRENILQQRREQVQDATQRFQRAHLPPSQRYRQTIRRHATNIEEALGQIQGSLRWSTQNSSVVSTTNARSCPPSAKHPTVSKSSQWQALSAVEAYPKLLQEQSTIEELQDHSSEGSQVSDSCVSESLSSKDSLENEDSNQSSLQSSFSSFLLNIENLEKRQDLTPTSDPALAPASMLLDKQEQQEDTKWSHDDMVVSKTSFGVTSEKQTPEKLTTHKDCDLFTLFSHSNGNSNDYKEKCLINIPCDKVLETNTVGADETKVGALYLKDDALLDFRSRMIHHGSQLTYPPAEDIHLYSGNGLLFEMATEKRAANSHLNDHYFLHPHTNNFHLSPEKETCASINNLNKVSKLMYKTEKLINTASLSHTSFSNIQSETVKCDCPKEEDKGIPVSGDSAHSVCDVGCLRSILKKQSRYTSEDACLYDSGRLILAKHVALAIRDSIELTRAKTKDVPVDDGAKKKLRWFDEVHHETESREENASKQDKDMSYSLCRPTNNSEDHHQSLTEPRLTPAASAGYHFTKEAWTDAGVQFHSPQERADKVTALRTSARIVGPRLPRRDRNARAVGGPVSSQTRKGTVIRPQSATEVNQFAKTQGKIIVPRPPPRTDLMKENTACIGTTPCVCPPSVNHEHTHVIEEAPRRISSVGEIFSPNTHRPVTTESAIKYRKTTASLPCPVGPFSDGNLNGTPGSGHQDAHSDRGKGMLNEKGLCLHSTPTDEEISQLWHGVRSALNKKEAKPGLKKQALESRRVCRKPSPEQSRQPPGAGSKILLQSSQNTGLIRPGPRTCNTVSQNEGFESAAQLHTVKLHPGDPVKQNPSLAQTRWPERVQEGLTTLSLEEKKIMLSLDRLNHQLYCLREHPGGRTVNNDNLLIGTQFTNEVKKFK